MKTYTVSFFTSQMTADTTALWEALIYSDSAGIKQFSDTPWGYIAIEANDEVSVAINKIDMWVHNAITNWSMAISGVNEIMRGENHLAYIYDFANGDSLAIVITLDIKYRYILR